MNQPTLVLVILPPPQVDNTSCTVRCVSLSSQGNTKLWSHFCPLSLIIWWVCELLGPSHLACTPFYLQALQCPPFPCCYLLDLSTMKTRIPTMIPMYPPEFMASTQYQKPDDSSQESHCSNNSVKRLEHRLLQRPQKRSRHCCASHRRSHALPFWCNNNQRN